MVRAAESAVVDSVKLAKSAPVLVQLAERQWGASASLPLNILPGVQCNALSLKCSEAAA